MGYTHYYYTNYTFDPTDFRKVAEDFKKLVPILEYVGAPLAGWSGEGKPEITDKKISFNGLKNCGHEKRDLGITWPADNAGGVNKTKDVAIGTWFAGAKLATRTCGGDCSHETFSLYQHQKKSKDDITGRGVGTRGKIFACTKTAYKPYDLAVTACLIIAKHYLGKAISVHSDGELKDWKDAMDMCQHFLGYGADFKLDDSDEDE